MPALVRAGMYSTVGVLTGLLLRMVDCGLLLIRDTVGGMCVVSWDWGAFRPMGRMMVTVRRTWYSVGDGGQKNGIAL